MRYAKIIDGAVAQYPITGTDIVRQNPNTSFPAGEFTPQMMADYGCLPVRSVDQPAFNAQIERVQEGTPVLQQARNPDGTFKSDDPVTPSNEAWEWVQTWEVVALTEEEMQQRAQQLQAEIVAQVQKRLDDFARTRNYDGILSAATYATSTVPKFAAEGQYAVEARDLTWATLYQVLAEVQAGTRPVPSGYADIESELPELIWPN